VCPGEWVYHYVNTTETGQYGPGQHLHFKIEKDADEGAAVAVTHHSTVVKVPPCRCQNALARRPSSGFSGSWLRHALGMLC